MGLFSMPLTMQQQYSIQARLNICKQTVVADTTNVSRCTACFASVFTCCKLVFALSPFERPYIVNYALVPGTSFPSLGYGCKRQPPIFIWYDVICTYTFV